MLPLTISSVFAMLTERSIQKRFRTVTTGFVGFTGFKGTWVGEVFWWQAPSPQKESAQSDVALGVIVIGWRLPITRGRQATEIFRELHLSVKLPVIPRRRGAIVVREEAEGESSTMTALGIARDSAAVCDDDGAGQPRAFADFSAFLHRMSASRQPHRELGEVTDFALDRDSTTVLLRYDLVADRQPKPGALAGRLGREERLE